VFYGIIYRVAAFLWLGTHCHLLC